MRGTLLGSITAVALAVAGSATPARAGQLFNFDLTVGSNVTNATLITNDLSSGSYLITGITGTFDGQPITSLLPVGTLGILGTLTDNLLLPQPGLLDSSGFAFSVGGNQEQILNTGTGGKNAFVAVSSGTPSTPAVLTVTVPEPATIGLFGIMLLSLGLLHRRRA